VPLVPALEEFRDVGCQPPKPASTAVNSSTSGRPIAGWTCPPARGADDEPYRPEADVPREWADFGQLAVVLHRMLRDKTSFVARMAAQLATKTRCLTKPGAWRSLG
jgi:hypothetical protein